MSRLRRLFRAKSSIDMIIMALVLCIGLLVFRHLNDRSGAHRLADGEDDGGGVEGDGKSEISLNDLHQQQQQQQQLRAASPTPVSINRSQRKTGVDTRIMRIGDFRSAHCRDVSDLLRVARCGIS